MLVVALSYLVVVVLVACELQVARAVPPVVSYWTHGYPVQEPIFLVEALFGIYLPMCGVHSSISGPLD